MVSKEDFMNVWKDSSRKNILNQYYYDYKTLIEEYEKWNELKECLEKVKRYVKEIDVIDKGELLLMLCEPEINKIEKEIESR